MGYVKNHLATLVSGVFATVLTGLYFVMPEDLWFIFTLAIPIMWFMVFICWISQKAADYNHGSSHDEKERLRKEIANLKTRVEIESIRAEIYNLKLLASQK